MDKDRAGNFLDKADRYLRWTAQYFDQMRAHGRKGELDAVERIFVSILLLIDSTHQALVDAAKKLDLTDWRDDLNQKRETDVLLRYLWLARNSETHDAIVKWRPDMRHVDLRIVDAVKADRIGLPQVWGSAGAINWIFRFVYDAKTQAELIERIKTNPVPSEKKLTDAGVEFLYALDSLCLDPFPLRRGGSFETIAAPTSHLGISVSSSADQVVFNGLEFYKNKFVQLKAAHSAA